MKERPILFYGSEVRAILDGRKTQTRRIVKIPDHTLCLLASGWSADRGDKGYAEFGDWKQPVCAMCPYGWLGDRLWVRETFHIIDRGTECGGAIRTIVYPATGEEVPFVRPDHPIHEMEAPKAYQSNRMPRWASRLTLEIVSVRVERLQVISEEDAIAEGIDPVSGLNHLGVNFGLKVGKSWLVGDTPSKAYQSLWKEIHGPGSWEANPWVWVLEFKRVEEVAL